MKIEKELKLKHNDIITFYGISWNDGWEFGNPNIILSPILRFTEDAGSIDCAIEELCLDLCIDTVKSDSIGAESWRDWDIKEFQEFVYNYFNNKEYEIPKYFINYLEYLQKDLNEELSLSSIELSDIINLSISEFKIKFIKEDDEEDEEWANYDYELINTNIKYIDLI